MSLGPPIATSPEEGVVDEVLLRDTPPDSSLRPYCRASDLLRDSSPGNGRAAPQYRHSPLILRRSTLLPGEPSSPPCMGSSTDGVTDLYRRCRRKDVSVLTCVDREDHVAESSASTRKAKSTSSSKPRGNSTTSIS